jgi:hypothetical protein
MADANLSIQASTSRPLGRLRRLAPVAGLWVLSPVCAEYLSGYQAENPLVLLGWLWTFGPLYGGVAVLVRETTRRAGRGWPTILMLGAAVGLIQAGVIDQSLFNPGYLDNADPTWAQAWRQERLATLVPPLGVSAHHLLGFVTGHMIMTIAAPIAVIEACVPHRADRPWLGWIGMAVMVVLYALAASYIVAISTVQFVAAPAQLIGTVAVAAALVVAAFTLPRRTATAPSSRRAPRPWVVGLVALVLLTIPGQAPGTWVGVAAIAGALGLLGGLLLVWSRRSGWSGAHVLMVAGAPLVSTVVASYFVADPLGAASPVEKYLSNTFLLVCVLALLTWAWRRTRRAETGVRAAAELDVPPQPAS